MVFRMEERVSGMRRLQNPYAPGIHILGAQLSPRSDWLSAPRIFVAGKGLSEAEGMVRLLGEAAERDAIQMRRGDHECALM
ncbi:hypothetical protein, partial [Pseudophaeobacter sp.]|uniref:hypothetical protein n=1 Tax=Pseudophaeobacter sp. TaxID=1971739 RepID=UPI0032968C33